MGGQEGQVPGSAAGSKAGVWLPDLDQEGRRRSALIGGSLVSGFQIQDSMPSAERAESSGLVTVTIAMPLHLPTAARRSEGCKTSTLRYFGWDRARSATKLSVRLSC